METIRMNIEVDELQFIINDLKDKIQELRDEKNLIDEKYHRLVDKIIEAKTRKKATELVSQMTKEQEEIMNYFRMKH
jgi:predicted nuclease with TOPRIM domain